MLHDVLDRPGRDDVPAVFARPGAHVDDPVGGLHRVIVVFDNEHGIAQVAHPEHGADQAGLVALVQADAGLIQHIQHAHELAADLGGQPNTLALAAAQRHRRPRQVQVIQTHIDHELQASPDFLDDLAGDLAVALAQRHYGGSRRGGQNSRRAGALAAIFDAESIHPGQGISDAEVADLGDILAGHPHAQHIVLQPLAQTGRAQAMAHVLLELVAHVVAGAVAIPPGEVLEHALPHDLVGVVYPGPVAILHPELLFASAIHQHFAGGLGELLPRRIDGDLVMAADVAHQLHVVAVIIRGRHRRDGAVLDAHLGVGHDQGRVELLLAAQPLALRAGPVGRVERK